MSPDTTPAEAPAGDPVPTDAELAASLEGGFTSAYAEVDGVRLHYVAGGEGEPLLLLGGWPHTWWEFHKVMPGLARRYRVIAVDIRGQGGSGKPASGYDKKTMAEDIHGLVRALGYERVHLAGHDIGAMVAYAYAANHPESVGKLALLDVPHPDETLRERTLLPPSADWQEHTDENDPSVTYLWWFAFNQVRGLPEQLLAGRARLIVDWMAGYLLKDPSRIPDHDRAVYARAYDDPEAIRAANGWYQTFTRDIEDFAGYEPVRLPVLMLATERTYGWLERIRPRHAPDARLTLVKDTGHYIPEEQPETTVRELTAFFG